MTRRVVKFPEPTPAGPPAAYTAERFKRRSENSRMSEYRSIPVARRAWLVKTTVIEACDWVLKVFAVPSLPADSHSFWIRRRRHAEQIVKCDREAGGDGSLQCVPFRRCKACGRVLIGVEANDYTEKLRLPRFRWEFSTGPSCGVACEHL